MKARIFRIFNDKKSDLQYTYVNTAKFRDDVEAIYHYNIKVPMMEVRIYNEDKRLGERTIMFASPEIVKTYTQIDFFNIVKSSVGLYEFNIRTSALGYSWEIDFEMVKGEYPYLNYLTKCGYRDELLAPIVDYPKILKMYKCNH